MKSLTSVFTALVVSLLFSCGSPKPFVPEDPEVNYIMLGNGGGFTGKTTTYYLLDNGKVYRKAEFKNDFSYIGKIDRELIKQQWQTYKNMNIADKKIDEPGNMYFFLDFKKGTESNKMTWGNSEDVDKVVETLYLNINNLVKKMNQSISDSSVSK